MFIHEEGDVFLLQLLYCIEFLCFLADEGHKSIPLVNFFVDLTYLIHDGGLTWDGPLHEVDVDPSRVVDGGFDGWKVLGVIYCDVTLVGGDACVQTCIEMPMLRTSVIRFSGIVLGLGIFFRLFFVLCLLLIFQQLQFNLSDFILFINLIVVLFAGLPHLMRPEHPA
jgi:hypothetical protein